MGAPTATEARRAVPATAGAGPGVRHRLARGPGAGASATARPSNPCRCIAALPPPALRAPRNYSEMSGYDRRVPAPQNTTPAPDHAGFLSTRLFSGLDGLRALSVIAVIWQHTSGRPGPEISSKGHFGVDLFFAISGVLITTLLLRERDRNGRISLSGFYIRRAGRIFPLYYVVLATYVVLVLATRAGTPEGQYFLQKLPAFLTYTSNWFVDLDAGNSVIFYFAWSLATEEQFYLFWPPLLTSILLLRSRRTAHTLAALGLLVIVSQVALASSSSSLLATVLGSVALPILLGAALAVILHEPTGFAMLRGTLGRRASAPVLGAAVIASLAVSTPEQVTHIFMALLVAAMCMREDSWLHPALRWRPLAWVGVISYGIYLMHMLVANAVRLVLGEQFSVTLFAATTVLAIAAASVSYRVFETPMVEYARRLSTRRMERPGTAADLTPPS